MVISPIVNTVRESSHSAVSVFGNDKQANITHDLRDHFLLFFVIACDYQHLALRENLGVIFQPSDYYQSAAAGVTQTTVKFNALSELMISIKRKTA